jgi:hypothetical protein
MIAYLNNGVVDYLAAADAIAVYVATVDGVPVRVGFTHDPRKTIAFLARRFPAVRIDWCAWFDESKDESASFINEISDNAGELLSRNGNARTLASIVAHVESLAGFEGVTLTPHERAIERAQAASERLNRALATLKATGELAAFNRAYRAHRRERQAKGESTVPFWAAQQVLRRMIIRQLASHDGFFVSWFLRDIRQQFPWFHAQYKPSHELIDTPKP